jgi:hypothetical protein
MTTDHAALLAAVEEDHPCDNSACDIAAMIGQGFGQIAAAMLCSATNEHAAVSALLASGADTLPADMYKCDDWPAWLEFHQTYGVKCEACEAYNYGDESRTPYSCGNCGAQLPDPTA